MATEAPPAAPTLPQYPEMILAAIDALNDPNGSNKSAISNYIESTYGDLPETHSTLLSHHLNRMKNEGELIMPKNNYMRPDPNAPPKRGRGRPPKAKSEISDAEKIEKAAVTPSGRGRGRPPKNKDSSEAKSKPVSGSGRPRGRPSKKAKVEDSGADQVGEMPAESAASTPVVDGMKRGRGRPPKVKPAVAAAVGA